MISSNSAGVSTALHIGFPPSIRSHKEVYQGPSILLIRKIILSGNSFNVQ
jgi:hypothetical protein